MNQSASYYKYIIYAAWIIMGGLILSGPVGVLLVSVIGGQPEWKNSETFIDHYHSVQTLPYIFGFIMLIGFILLVAALKGLAISASERFFGNAAIILITIYAVMIGINYTMQLAFVPILVHEGSELTGYITMANPNSIGWILEMYGYAFLGLALWSLSCLFKGSQGKMFTRYLLIVNGVISILGAIVASLDMNWVLSHAGLISYVIWNILILVILIMIIVEFSKNSKQKSTISHDIST